MPMGESLILACRFALSSISEEIDTWAILFQHHDGLLPVRQPADAEAEAALLALAVLRPHLLDDHAEELLHRRLDLVLARPRVHFERVAPVVRRLVRALLRDQRADDHLMRFELRPARLGGFVLRRHRRLLLLLLCLCLAL